MSIFLSNKIELKRPCPLRVAILGASGSIGMQTLDVCRSHPDKVKVVALSVNSQLDKLCRAAQEFSVAHAAIEQPPLHFDKTMLDLPKNCRLHVGKGATAELARLEEVDCVVSAVVGFAGIYVGYEALKAHKILAYANKESIVCAGDLLMPLVEAGQLIPVDSEHNAIYQCLQGEDISELAYLWLTCSGGPFYGKTREDLKHVKAEAALRHPTWRMGAKITIDSATLMNKGLEILEAHQLFNVPIDKIRVLIQKQSRIHSMVEFIDGSTKAQLGPSDMRIPIQYALSFPKRWTSPVKTLNYCEQPPISFGEADEKTFGCLALAKEAGQIGGILPCALNAANEVANEAFRRGVCGFLDIEATVAYVMGITQPEKIETIDQLICVDKRSRAYAREYLKRKERTVC